MTEREKMPGKPSPQSSEHAYGERWASLYHIAADDFIFKEFVEAGAHIVLRACACGALRCVKSNENLGNLKYWKKRNNMAGK